MKKKLLIILFLLLGYSISAQRIINIPLLYADKKIILNVKQYGQFVKRFNYEEDFTGNPVNKEFRTKIDRGNYILYLFNNKDKRLSDTVYLKQIEEFINLVVTDSLKINRLSDSTFAYLKCQVTFNNIPQKLYLVLHMEKVHKGYCWSLFNAYSTFLTKENTSLNKIPTIRQRLKLIPPTSNELNFMHLKKVFEDKDDIFQYTSGKGIGNGLISLINLLQANELEFNYVENLKYYIFDVRGWVMEVSEFIRDTENSGWLISNISKSTENANYYIANLAESLQKK